jgi:hypothetical protein
VGGEAGPTAESLAVRSFAPDRIPWPLIAFQTTAWALRDWLSMRHPEVAAAASTEARWPADSP